MAHARLDVLRGHLAPLAERDAGGASPAPCLAPSGSHGGSKVVSAEEAVSGIRDGDVLTVGGFVGCGCPELVLAALRRRFDATSHPRDLHLIGGATTGDRKGGGLDVLAVEGLLGKFTFGWTGNCPGLIQLIRANKLQAWNLPLGIVSHMIRDAAAGRPGPVSRIGLGTFVDCREQGGKANAVTREDVVSLVTLHGREFLHYRAPRVGVAVLRGTTADEAGNVSFERECFTADALNQAIAAHNTGGLVVVQVERLAAAGSLPMRAVHLPGALVDKVVLAPPEQHSQSLAGPGSDASLSGQLRRPLAGLKPLSLDARKVIAHRCMLALSAPRAAVNLGVGMPEGVAVMVGTHAAQQCPNILPITLSTEVGVVGGLPAGGARFGAAHNADAVMPTSTMVDLIQGGGLDATVLGCAEVDAGGNVNVSCFSGRQPGCGGFIDISQSARQVLFAGTFRSGGLKVALEGGRLRILQEGRDAKFKRRVQQKTFAGASADGRQVLYVTERCVFGLAQTAEGPRLELLELGPGVRLQQDVLDLMEFRPIVRDVRLMDARCFAP